MSERNSEIKNFGKQFSEKFIENFGNFGKQFSEKFIENFGKNVWTKMLIKEYPQRCKTKIVRQKLPDK